MRNLVNNKSHWLLFSLMAACFLVSCGKSGGNENDINGSAQDQSNDTKLTQYYVKGEQLYLKYCSNCHQENGTGLGRLYPPLNASDYLHDNLDDAICTMRYGKRGEIIVNGKSFNKEMPGNPSLTDLEIAEIATYIYNSWGMKRGIIDVKAVSQTLNKCPGN